MSHPENDNIAKIYAYRCAYGKESDNGKNNAE